ncbi:hypothetical protein ACFZBU_08755 [Embleya sp. NPDC008237]|uniref:hypothetical protein n=1 Tax=Embleya sp. NPDC008237 TaxID=3363978 RepID=UPI0036EA7223
MAGQDSAPGGGGSGFRLSVEALEAFQGALQGVLADLVDSADSPANATKYTIGEGDLGVSFAEAPLIGGVLKETADRLQTLINTLHGQIAKMKQNIKTTGNNVVATDDEQRRATLQIQQVLNGGSQPPVVDSPPRVPQAPPANRKVDLG